MNAKFSRFAVAATLSFGLTVPNHAASTQSGRQVIGWVSFDVPNSTYTRGRAINDLGEVAGVYADVNGIFHSFLRKGDGKMIPFDPPGAGTGANASGIVSVRLASTTTATWSAITQTRAHPTPASMATCAGRTARSRPSTTRIRTARR